MQAKNSIILRVHNTFFRTLYYKQIRCSSAIRKDEKRKEPQPGNILKEKLSKRFPRAFKIIATVKNGFTGVWNDGRAAFNLISEVTNQKRRISQFSLEELDLYFERWEHISNLLPLLVIGVLPFGNGVVAFLAYWKPLRFLSSHFWTEEQKAAYVIQSHQQRVSNFEPIIRHLHVASGQLNRNDGSYTQWTKVLEKLRNGKIPAPSEVARCTGLFEHRKPFALRNFNSDHINHLLALHVLHGMFRKKSKLEKWAAYLIHVDRRIKTMGGASQLSSERLKRYCFQRGLNAHKMSEKEMREWLDQFAEFSSHINARNYCLMLHAPAIFGINHQSNKLSISKNS